MTVPVCFNICRYFSSPFCIVLLGRLDSTPLALLLVHIVNLYLNMQTELFLHSNPLVKSKRCNCMSPSDICMVSSILKEDSGLSEEQEAACFALRAGRLWQRQRTEQPCSS